MCARVAGAARVFLPVLLLFTTYSIEERHVQFE